MPESFQLKLQTALGAGYRLDRELGGGGMSRAFLANETRFGRRVVIKVLTPELIAGLSVERFEREVVLAAALQEPNIVPVLTAGDADGMPYYTMPFVDGLSLRQRMQQSALPPELALSVLHNVIAALVYAHARAIVHRDIKPENVLLSGNTAVVTDFGIARALLDARDGAREPTSSALTATGTSLGSPAYMAPEQAAGDEVDIRADLYAWGVMAYELLAGTHPFAEQATAQRMIVAHLTVRPKVLSAVNPAVSAPLSDLVMQCLEKTPDDRPASAETVEATLRAIMRGSTASIAVGYCHSNEKRLRRLLQKHSGIGHACVHVYTRAYCALCASPGIRARVLVTLRNAASISRLLRRSSWAQRLNASMTDETTVKTVGVAIGRIAGIVLAVVYTDRMASDGLPERRIISARVSKRRERQIHKEAYPEI